MDSWIFEANDFRVKQDFRGAESFSPNLCTNRVSIEQNEKVELNYLDFVAIR